MLREQGHPADVVAARTLQLAVRGEDGILLSLRFARFRFGLHREGDGHADHLAVVFGDHAVLVAEHGIFAGVAAFPDLQRIFARPASLRQM